MWSSSRDASACPAFTAIVPRSRQVRVECLDETAAPRVIEASGWYARILQHEIDHLQGTSVRRPHAESHFLFSRYPRATVEEQSDGRSQSGARLTLAAKPASICYAHLVPAGKLMPNLTVLLAGMLTVATVSATAQSKPKSPWSSETLQQLRQLQHAALDDNYANSASGAPDRQHWTAFDWVTAGCRGG